MCGDFHDAASVDAAVAGQDAVLVTASASGPKAFRETPRYFSQGTALTIDAMKAHGVQRLVVLSAIGAGESRQLLGVVLGTLLVDWILKLPYEDHERQEAMVRESGLDWVIARPGRLTHGPARKRYIRRTDIGPLPSSISRADVADFMLDAVESSAWIRRAVQLGG